MPLSFVHPVHRATHRIGLYLDKLDEPALTQGEVHILAMLAHSGPVKVEVAKREVLVPERRLEHLDLLRGALPASVDPRRVHGTCCYHGRRREGKRRARTMFLS